MKTTTALAAVLVVACSEPSFDRPGTWGTRGGDNLGGGGGGGGGGGTGSDGGPARGDVLEGFVRRLEDVSRSADRGDPVGEATIRGTGPDGDAITTTSGPDGAFVLEGIELEPVAILSVDGEPGSRVVVEPGRADEVVAPVIEAAFLEEVASAVGVTVEGLSGHAFVWIRDELHVPIEGLGATVTSVSPVRGPFYDAGDPVLLSETGPTGRAGLVALLAGLPDDYRLDVFPAGEPDSSVGLTIEIEAGVVTFYEATIRF